MRKAQIEIMGFVVVVILVTLGLFFSVALQSQPETKPAIEVYSDEKLADNFIVTLVETDVEGADATVRRLAIDCIRHRETGRSKFAVNGDNSCEAFENIAETVLNDSLKAWGRGYNFTYDYRSGGSTENVFWIGTECTGERNAPGFLPIDLYRVVPGEALIILEVCQYRNI